MLVNRSEIFRRLIASLVVSVAEKHRIFRCELLKKREGLPVDAGLSHDHIATHDHQIRICLINRLQKAFLVFPVKAAREDRLNERTSAPLSPYLFPSHSGRPENSSCTLCPLFFIMYQILWYLSQSFFR